MKKTLLALAIAALFTACTSVPTPPPDSDTGYASGMTPKGEVQPICQPTPWDVGCYGQKGGGG